jgi:NADH-quinone oxidoreductase subunit J
MMAPGTIVRKHTARRAPAWTLLLALVIAPVIALLGPLAGQAHAQGEPGGEHAPAAVAPAGQPAAADAHGHPHAEEHPGPAGGDGHGAQPSSLNEDNTTAAVFFWLFALMMVGGAVFVITRRNLISAVMGMVGTFFAIAAVFTMLYAHFLAAIQVLVYAGAIMVLFVFVIMIMNKPEDDPWGRVGRVGNVVAVALIAYLLWRVGMVLWHAPVEPGMLAPPPQVAISHGTVEEMVEFGSTKAIGDSLFHEYLFPFEAVSLVLLIAVVGALAVARPHEKQPAATPASEPSSMA